MGRTRQTARQESSGPAPQTSVAFQAYQARISVPSSSSSSSSSSRQPPVPAPKLISHDVSYESSFYSHYFETGVEKEREFAPSYTVASANDPFTGELKNWVSLYFNSKFDGQEILKGRPVLNLVVALDISGSMSMAFAGELEKQKIQVAKESLITLLGQLQPNDSFGLVVFNSEATVVQRLERWSSIDHKELERNIQNLRASGGTTISKAMVTATNLYVNASEASNRIFFLTDMEISEEDGKDFVAAIQRNSSNSMWATVIGVGLDLTQNVIRTVSCTPGCNYCNVRTTANFGELMMQEFGFMVTPIAYNIEIRITSSRYELVQGYGSPEVSRVDAGNLVRISTEFPSSKNATGETRSGVFLFRVKDKSPNTPHEPFQVSVLWYNMSGLKHSEETALVLPPKGYQNNSIRKAVLLVDYTDFVKNYLQLRSSESNASTIGQFMEMRRLYPSFVTHFQSEKQVIGDDSLHKEFTNLLDTAKTDDIPLNSAQTSSANPAVDPTPAPSPDSNNNNNNAQSSVEVKATGQTKDDDTCCVCLASKKSVVLLPCRHLCLCVTCSKTLVECPLCRVKIENRVQAFV